MKNSSRTGVGLLGLGLVASALAVTGASPAAAADPVDIQILATNDFHGRLLANNAEAGAAVLAGAVKQLREENPNTVFAAAGDLIGASTFESFIAEDKPTIDVLNEAGLDVSAVGNHELDQGYDDLTERVMAPYDAVANPNGGAEWEYIAANLALKSTGDPAVPAIWTKEMDGVTVGFVGAVTEELPSLVSAEGIADLDVEPIVESVNTYADELTTEGGADVVVMLVHEGSPTTDCATMDDAGTTWGDIVTGVNENVDAIVSGHTHLAYNCEVDGRPVVSAGQYGTNLNRLNVSVDPDTGDITEMTTELLPLAGNYPADPATQAIVDAAVAEADVLGAEELGQLAAGFNRARITVPGEGGAEPTITDSRGGESTLGNLIADVQQWATEAPESGGAQIAFMAPGGLRADMLGGIEGEDAYPKTLTYKQAAVVQPFANTLVNMKLTGAQIETVLEQQWQRNPDGTVPSRPFLRLAVSDGFTYTYDETPVTVEGTETFEGEITGMWLDGEPIDPAASYSITVNSFLATGTGDNFFEFGNGTDKADTGKIDLSAVVDYLAASEGAIVPDFGQRAVQVSFPESAPAGYVPGDEVAFDLASLSMSAPGDTVDEEVEVTLDGESLGTFPVDSTRTTMPYDATGTASVAVTVPEDTAVGPATLVVTGATTGTEVAVPVSIAAESSTNVRVTPKRVVKGKTKAKVRVKVTAEGEAVDGQVRIKVGKKTWTRTLDNGAASVRLKPFKKAGKAKVTVRFLGSATAAPSMDTATVKVVKAKRKRR